MTADGLAMLMKGAKASAVMMLTKNILREPLNLFLVISTKNFNYMHIMQLISIQVVFVYKLS